MYITTVVLGPLLCLGRITAVEAIPIRNTDQITKKGSTRPQQGVAWNSDHPPTSILQQKALQLRGGSLNPVTKLSEWVGSNKARCWTVLMMCVTLDTSATTLLKMAQDEQSTAKSIMAYISFALSISGFGLALGGIDVSIAYAVWAALGTAVVSTAGILLFGESCSPTKVLCLLMIGSGVVGLNLIEEH